MDRVSLGIMGEHMLPEPRLQRRALICYLLQLLPWGIFTGFVVIGIFMDILIDLSDDTIKAIRALYWIFGVLLAILAILGFLASLFNYSPGFSFILLIIFGIVFILACIGYLTTKFADNQSIFAISAGLSMLILTGIHFLISFCLKTPVIQSYSVTIWAACTLTSSIIFIMDEVMESGTQRPNLLYEILVGTIFFGLIGSAWCSAMKISLPIAYFSIINKI